jgi:ATP-dependent Clp protease ATP-binding subunit ClpA
VFGARPLRRVIERNIEDQLSEAVISGTYLPGDTVEVDLDAQGDKLVITRRAGVQPDPEAEPAASS